GYGAREVGPDTRRSRMLPDCDFSTISTGPAVSAGRPDTGGRLQRVRRGRRRLCPGAYRGRLRGHRGDRAVGPRRGPENQLRGVGRVADQPVPGTRAGAGRLAADRGRGLAAVRQARGAAQPRLGEPAGRRDGHGKQDAWRNRWAAGGERRSAGRDRAWLGYPGRRADLAVLPVPGAG